MSSPRLNITLDGEHAAKLVRLAAQVHVNEGTLARSRLSSTIDGAWERAQLGVTRTAAGDTISLGEL